MPVSAHCRECGKEVAGDAPKCKKCGALHPADPDWKGEGFEWKSRGPWRGDPLVHVACGCDSKGRARTARGVVAVGQRAVGAVACGIVAGGFICVGVVSCGVFSLGVVSVALGCAVGVNAIAPYAVGVTAVGIVTHGLATVGWEALPK